MLAAHCFVASNLITAGGTTAQDNGRPLSVLASSRHLHSEILMRRASWFQHKIHQHVFPKCLLELTPRRCSPRLSILICFQVDDSCAQGVKQGPRSYQAGPLSRGAMAVKTFSDDADDLSDSPSSWRCSSDALRIALRPSPASHCHTPSVSAPERSRLRRLRCGARCGGRAASMSRKVFVLMSREGSSREVCCFDLAWKGLVTSRTRRWQKGIAHIRAECDQPVRLENSAICSTNRPSSTD